MSEAKTPASPDSEESRQSQGAPTDSSLEEAVLKEFRSGGGVTVAPYAASLSKRVLDVVGALTALALLAPLLLVVAVLIKLESDGPVVLRQKRLGREGRVFSFYKFRTMRLQEDWVAVADPAYTVRQDPRITRVGRFLRKTSIDELPQLYNVLKGDMSLVGPRPPLLYEALRYSRRHLHRLQVKPGLTGLWQVEGRGRATFEEMVRMDLNYVTSTSLSLDLEIIARTVVVMLRADAAA